jgi:hypothetical protein
VSGRCKGGVGSFSIDPRHLDKRISSEKQDMRAEKRRLREDLQGM